MARKILLGNVIRKQWLLVGIVICIIFACIYPRLGSKEGPLKPEITVKYFAVPTIFLLGYTTLVPIFSTVFQLVVTVLLPLFLGQLLKKYSDIREHNLPLNMISQLALLFVVYTTFCDTFMTPDIGLDAIDVLITVALVLFIHFVLIVASFRIAWYFRKYFTASDVVAIAFCSTHKSLTLGIPILRLMFQGYSHLHQISLPLMVYHPIQIILGGVMGIQMKDWIQKQSIRRLPV
ncbi:hypothetical protein AMK59_8546 [Oryctes borbonicus]|uniref:Bile acid:sodium symporter n=1 Tax=Oryctes borbonicus TaxID=1629725 RepID=A0A0T6ATH3_9SCAR|nr:hypothetical protein AMK59_8546 [Oryctes borbonicus]